MIKRLFKNRPILRIAFVHLWSKKRQTLVAMLGVMFGITVFIFQAGLITGLQTYMLDKIVNNSFHIHLFVDPDRNPAPIAAAYPDFKNNWVVVRNQKVKDEDKKIKNSTNLMALIERHPSVSGVAPNMITQAICKAGIKELPVTISGVDIDKENKLFNLYKEQVAGDIMRLNTISNGIILGKGVANKIGAEVDDILSVATTNTVIDCKVVAITQSGITTVDDSRAYLNLRAAQNLINKDVNYITDINIKLKEVEKADLLAEEFGRAYGYRSVSWKEANAGIFGVFKIQNMATVLVITSILIVAGFGIFNILMMMIYEKMTDIAILKSIGYKNRDIKTLFMIEALVIGLVGGTLGIILGYGVSWAASQVEVTLKGLITVNRLQINFDPLFYLSGFAFAILSTAAAGYFPAVKAAKVDPVDIIRGK
jgi:lipoprotein-releasing system permease protein